MFDSTSRYYPRETATFTTADGREITYVKRRFLPQGEDLVLLVEATVSHGERLDQLAARTLGDPEQYWRICDANNGMNPADLLEEPGQTVRVPVPKVET